MSCQPDGQSGSGGQGGGLTASGLYNRSISIARQAASLPAGNAGFRGLQQSAETTIFTDLACTISFYTRGPDPAPGVPSDAIGRTLWYLTLPTGLVTEGSIVYGDVATDDLGRRFKCNEPLWGAIDVQIEAELLRT